jgi:hypothetical protein
MPLILDKNLNSVFSKQLDNEEQEFQKGIRATEWFKEFKQEYGEEPDLDIEEYDYRAAWKAGVTPERDPYDNNRYHWGSVNPKTGEMLKSKDHPTAWKQYYMDMTGKNPDEVGATRSDYEKMTLEKKQPPQSTQE